MINLRDITGQVFSLLTVISFHKFVGEKPNRRVYWVCRCVCGNTTLVEGGNLRSGNVRSCGCLAKNNLCQTTHGMSKTPTYISWAAMIQRCTDPKSVNYSRYGARGIIVCERWKQFAAFLNDMGVRPLGTQLERIENFKGYSPDNCRWATRKEQARNRRSSKHIVVNGERITVAEAAERAGVEYKKHWKKLKRNGHLNHDR